MTRHKGDFTKFSNGFTLAEVLITLGIIGVVAALTLPTLINTTNKKEIETALKKQYSLLQQAVISIKQEDDMTFEFESYYNNFSKRLAKEYKEAIDCGSINNNQGCILMNEDKEFTHYKTLNGKSLDRGYFDDGSFITTDGTIFLIEEGGQSATTGYLATIDVNGYQKRPNKMGVDLFMFQITKEGRVLPMGAEGTYWSTQKEELCSKTSSSNRNGFTCTYYALTDNNYFKKL